jgi:hypothetical protein
MRSVAMRMRLLLYRTVGVAMAVCISVVMAVAMTIAIGNRLRHCMTAWIAFVAMAVIMTVSGFRIDRLREPALFTNLRRFGGFIIVLSPTPFSMSNKAFERGFVHMTGQWNS